MKNLLSDHPALVLALVFFVGWTLHWVVGLLFFRARYFAQESEITRQSRELEDARFQLSRAHTDLQSKADLLDAIQRSKSGLESRLGVLESELRTARGAIAEVTALSETHAAAAQAALNASVPSRNQGEAPTASDGILLSPDPILEAQVKTLQAQADALQSRLGQLVIELNESQVARRGLVASLAAEQSVRASLTRALQSRDVSIAELEQDRDGAKERLSKSEQHRASTSAERDQLHDQIDATTEELKSERKSKAQLEQRIKERETHLAELELKSQEYLAAFNDAAEENQRISTDLKQARTRLSDSDSTLKSSSRELQGAKSRLAELETELSTARTGASTASRSAQDALDSREKEIARLTLEIKAAKEHSERLNGAHAELEDQLASQVRDIRKLKDQNEELLEELQAATKANQSLTEQLAGDAPNARDDAEPDSQLASLLADLDTVSRERNELAAELAILKSNPAVPKRTKREATTPANSPENELL